jgi:hypothetical protein
MPRDAFAELMGLEKYAQEDPRIQALKRMHETGPSIDSLEYMLNGPQAQPSVPEGFNEQGWDEFLAQAPESQNIIDRRDEPDVRVDAIAKLLRRLGQ